MNDKRIQRLWREEGLKVPYRKRKKPHRGIGTAVGAMCPIAPNALWAMDFQFDTTVDGRTIKLCNIVDEYTRECPAIVVDRSIDADKVVACLDRLLLTRGAPAFVRFDNGGCFKSRGFAAWVASKRHIIHIRTRKKAPWTNGVIERFFGALKYERLYRHDIGDGVQLVDHAVDFRTIYNSIRPHETIGMSRPLERYRQTPTTNIPDPESVSDA